MPVLASSAAGRLAASGVGLALVAALAGCGSSAAATTRDQPSPANAQSLPAARPVPTDFTSLAAVERQLSGVASCAKLGTTTSQCHLVTMPTVPFLVEIFTDAGQRASYLDNLEAQDALAKKSGGQPHSGLAGPSWVVTSTVVDPGLYLTLHHYLGGTRVA